MLYQRWCEIVEKHPSRLALHDSGSGRNHTFEQLHQLAQEVRLQEKIVFPSNRNLDFFLTVLGAWRTGAIVLPLEPGQSAPASLGWLPGTVHLKTTSATGGLAQLICFSGEQLLADVTNIMSTMNLSEDCPNLGVISLAHSYGFSNLVLPLLLFGVPLVLVASPLPAEVKTVAARFDRLALPAVPALWRAWHDAGAIPSNLEVAISAGAPLNIALEQEIFSRTGLKVHNFYGSSECGGIAFDRSSNPRTESAIVGEAMDNVTLTIGGEGCLEVRSGAVGLGYWPEREALADGVFKTSDLAEIKDGTVYLRGRRSDQINIAGRKIAPEQIEELLLKHPRVKDCLVFGVPARDEARTESVVACVEGRGELSVEELRHFLLQQVPAWQVPRGWWFVELKINERGKRSRTHWREKYLKRES